MSICIVKCVYIKGIYSFEIRVPSLTSLWKICHVYLCCFMSQSFYPLEELWRMKGYNLLSWWVLQKMCKVRQCVWFLNRECFFRFYFEKSVIIRSKKVEGHKRLPFVVDVNSQMCVIILKYEFPFWLYSGKSVSKMCTDKANAIDFWRATSNFADFQIWWEAYVKVINKTPSNNISFIIFIEYKTVLLNCKVL